MKPIFRWTIGNVKKGGYECLEMSIKTMLKLYKDKFDYYICCNNINIQKLREIIGQRPIKIIQQTWNDCPLSINYEENIGTSLWKFCPARLNINAHEIVCDNDIVLINHIEEIESFLNDSKILLVEDPIKFQGKFRHLFNENEKYNAGFVGLPPHYNLQEELNITWQENNSPQIIDQGDEQGLTTATLKKNEFIKISKETILLVHNNGETVYFGYNPETNKNKFDCKPITFFKKNTPCFHFVGLNKTNHHNHWELFKKIIKNKLMI